MGRGRAKAKQVKVARQLKYSGGGADLDRLRAELGVGTDQQQPDDYSDLADRYADGDGDDDDDDDDDDGLDDLDDDADLDDDDLDDDDLDDDDLDDDDDDLEREQAGDHPHGRPARTRS
jgi:Protein of unknown function (DUF3073)